MSCCDKGPRSKFSVACRRGRGKRSCRVLCPLTDCRKPLLSHRYVPRRCCPLRNPECSLPPPLWSTL